jgi:hypothetical protein
MLDMTMVYFSKKGCGVWVPNFITNTDKQYQAR